MTAGRGSWSDLPVACRYTCMGRRGQGQVPCTLQDAWGGSHGGVVRGQDLLGVWVGSEVRYTFMGKWGSMLSGTPGESPRWGSKGKG